MTFPTQQIAWQHQCTTIDPKDVAQDVASNDACVLSERVEFNGLPDII